ncbi:MAG: hypothetical protein MR270_05050 [Erysipelotrichaceae bacterium]|nr:hypothetical protein [Erysipelotrichaceae bacterium]
MEKRSERNKELYVQVNQQIAKKAKMNANGDLQDSFSTLQKINPKLFGNNNVSNENNASSLRKKESKIKKKLIVIGAFIFTMVIIILIAWVISNGK